MDLSTLIIHLESNTYKDFLMSFVKQGSHDVHLIIYFLFLMSKTYVISFNVHIELRKISIDQTCHHFILVQIDTLVME